MSGPRRRKFVGPLVSRVTWHGGRGRQRSRWALIIALGRRIGFDRLEVEGGGEERPGVRVLGRDQDARGDHGREPLLYYRGRFGRLL